MANKIQIRRGNYSGLPTGSQGEPLLCQDTQQVFIGTSGGNLELKTVPAGAQAIYMATTALGGRGVASAGATGLALASGASTMTYANHLVDSGASFTTDMVGKTVYNSTDDTWAKVTARNSATDLTIDADIFVSGESYVVCDAIDNLQESFNRIKDGFNANATVRVSPGSFSGGASFVGKNPAGGYTLTVQGSTTGTTTFSGDINCYQRISLRNLTLTGKVKTYFGSDISWYDCATSGNGRIYTYNGAPNYFHTCTVTFGNDPVNIVSVGSTVTRGYTMYVALSTYGGDDSVADGLAMTSGTATSTTANKLVDSGANFGTDVVGRTVYNSTDDTWAKVTARDSSTQLSLSADIMASGEAYVISNAFATIQKAIDAVPGTVNCDTSIKVSDGTFTEDLAVQGKKLSGPYKLTLKGTLILIESLTASAGTQGSGGTQGTATRSSGTWTASQRQHKLIKFTSGNNNGTTRLIDDNTTTVITIVDIWPSTVVNGDTFKVLDWGTIIQCNTAQVKVTGQTGMNFEDLRLTPSSPAWPLELYGGSAVTLTRCLLDKGLAVQEPNIVYCYDTIVLGTGASDLGIYLQQGSLYGYRSKVYKCGYGIRALAMSFVLIRDGFIVDGAGVCTYGVWTERNSVARFDSAGSEGYTRIKNCTTGVYANRGGMAVFTSTIVYSGNTTNENADAVSFGYVD